MKDQMYYPSIRFEDMTNLELKLFRALRALIITVGVSSIYCFFSKHFFNTFFHIIYLYMCVCIYIYIYIFVSGFWRPLRPWRCWRCWRLWEFVETYFQKFGFHLFLGFETCSNWWPDYICMSWSHLRPGHADMFQPGALTCLLQFVWFGNVLPNRYAIQI